MRTRIYRALLAATAAGVSVIAAGMTTGAVGAAVTRAATVGPSGGPPVVTDTTCTFTSPLAPANDCARAGYQASGRDFRYIQASIVVPDHNGVVGTDPAAYIDLNDTSDTAYDVAMAGITPVTGGVGLSGWALYGVVAQPTGASFAPALFGPIALPVADEGLGIFVSVYLAPTGNAVHVLIKTPTAVTTAGQTFNHTFAVDGPVYTHAEAVADWTPSSGTGTQTEPAQPDVANTDATVEFFDGRLTTWSGSQGTFNGPWTVNPVEATTDGNPAVGTSLVAGPSYLWTNDSHPGDAFGVWIYPSLTCSVLRRDDAARARSGEGQVSRRDC
jgi:hypothetical protein